MEGRSWHGDHSWHRAAWVGVSGPRATVSFCRATSVMLNETIKEAQGVDTALGLPDDNRMTRRIRTFGCESGFRRCSGRHVNHRRKLKSATFVGQTG